MLIMSLRRSLRNPTAVQVELSSTPKYDGKLYGKRKMSPKPKPQLRSRAIRGESPDLAASSDAPSTPPAKRARRASTSDQLPNGAVTSEDSLPAQRPAEPHRTNATLKTPGGTRLVPYSKEVVESSPSKAGLPRPTTTTSQLLGQACAHLISVDVRMKPLIEKYHCRMFSAEGLAEETDPWESLCSGIMSQQVSGAAAKSIKNKFVNLFDDGAAQEEHSLNSSKPFPRPSQLIGSSIPFLRTAGLSERKAEYIKGLAEKFESKDLSAEMLLKASDEEVLEKLVAVRGLGRWSAEMFACFGLKRADVFSTGDLGVQRGMAAFIGKDVKKLKNKGGKWKYLSEKEMLDLSAPFSPYRSVFMWYMWKVEDTDVDAFGSV